MKHENTVLPITINKNYPTPSNVMNNPSPSAPLLTAVVNPQQSSTANEIYPEIYYVVDTEEISQLYTQHAQK